MARQIDRVAPSMSSGGCSESDGGSCGLPVSRNCAGMFAASPMVKLGGRTNFGNAMTLRLSMSAGTTVYGNNKWRSSVRLVGAA